MIYILMVVLVITISLLSFGANIIGRQASLFRLIAFFYAMSLFLYLLYLGKDPNYMGFFLEYFPLPRVLILQLYTLRLSRLLITSLMNLNSLLFLYCNIVFAISFLLPRRPRLNRRLYIGIGVYCLFQMLLFEPRIYCRIYALLYPAVLSSARVENIYAILSGITRTANILLLAGCIGIVILRIIHSPGIQLLRLAMLGFGTSYSLLLISYLFFFNRLPATLVKYSKVADIITYRPLVANRTMGYYQLYPYLVCAFLVLFALSFFRLSLLRHRMNDNELQIAQNIKAANLSSRLFCHYMKNEILAISAETEQLPLTAETQETIANIQERCRQVYNKLDGIHHSMRDDLLEMRMVDIGIVIQSTLEHLQDLFAAEDIEAKLDISPPNIPVLIDRPIIEQALQNLFNNACDAMAGQAVKQLTVTVRQDVRWVYIDVEDNGSGIAEKDLENIFTPLFSSKPMTKNWGIGLTLAHKAITSHGGSIHVASTQGLGTVFQLLLPAAHL